MKKTVFISSTYEDLKKHRSKVWDLLQKYQVDIRGMEEFGARTDNSLKTCINESELSDIYIGIIGMRYGSIDKNSGKSYTCLEYEAAYEKDREILFFTIDETDSKVPPIFVDTGDRREKLDSFKKLIKDRHTVASYVDEEDLVKKVKLSLDKVLNEEIQEQTPEDIEAAKTLINNFLLMPKTYSSKTVNIKFRIKGKPFPASKQVCNHFNLIYGKAVGFTIDVEEPKVEHFTNYLFIEGDKYEKYELNKDVSYTASVILKFTENVIDTFKARFVREEFTRYYLQSADSYLKDVNIWSTVPKEEKVVYEPEGTIICY